MIEFLAVAAALILLFGVALLLDRRRRKIREKDTTWLIPNPVLEELFTVVGLRFVDRGKIPNELLEAGWNSLTYQKRLKHGSRIDPRKFRENMVQQGWKIHTFKLDTRPESIGRSLAKLFFPLTYDTTSVVDVVHFVLGPDGEGESVVLRSEHVAFRSVNIETETGETERHFSDIWYEPGFMPNPDPCTELFDELEKLPRQNGSLNGSDAVERSALAEKDRGRPSTRAPRSADSINFCTQCGKRVFPGAKFCTGCGAALADGVA